MTEPPPFGEELNKLVSAVQEWARRAAPQATAAAGEQHSDCPVWCPICQFAHVLRAEYPEVADRVAEAGTAIAGALKAFAEAAVARAQVGAETGADGAAGGRARPQPAPRVQHIHLDDPTES